MFKIFRIFSEILRNREQREKIKIKKELDKNFHKERDLEKQRKKLRKAKLELKELKKQV